ncbi:MAG: hypothetical protein KIH67_004630, partial [Candidatus Moranbacteria bacterium]|nr:hypothetical protein [Candidatus Moranbacteria bacterium]
MNRFNRRLFGAMVLLGATLAVPTAAHATRGPDGYYQWSRVGASAMTRFQNGTAEPIMEARSRALHKMGLNAYETQYALDAMRNGNYEQGVITRGTRFKTMSYATPNEVSVIQNVELTADGEYIVYRVRIPAGPARRAMTITFVKDCSN